MANGQQLLVLLCTLVIVGLQVDGFPHARRSSTDDSIPRRRHPHVYHRHHFLVDPTCYWENVCNMGDNPKCTDRQGKVEVINAGIELHAASTLWQQMYRALLTLEGIMEDMSGTFCDRRFPSEWCEFNLDIRREMESQHKELRRLREQESFVFDLSCTDEETLKHLYNDYKMDLARLHWLLKEEENDVSLKHISRNVWKLLIKFFADSICNVRSLLFNSKDISESIHNLDMEFMHEIIHDEMQHPEYKDMTPHKFRYVQFLKVKDSWTASRDVLKKCAGRDLFPFV